MRIPHNKIHLTPEQIEFIHDNHGIISNQAIADHLGMKLRTLRTRMYTMGLTKFKMRAWVPEQIDYLIKHYQTKGNTEIAKYFNTKYPKQGSWLNTTINGKMIQLGLKRTPEQLKAIHAAQTKCGAFSKNATKRWQTQGTLPDGTIRYYTKEPGTRPQPHIRINGKFKPWSRWMWRQHKGPIPAGHLIVFKGDNKILTIENLECVEAKEYRLRMNKSCQELTDNYLVGLLGISHPHLRDEIRNSSDLLQAKRIQLLLNRKIKQLQNG